MITSKYFLMVDALSFSALVTKDNSGKYIARDAKNRVTTTNGSISVDINYQSFEAYRDDSLTGAADVRSKSYAPQTLRFTSAGKLAEKEVNQLVSTRGGNQITKKAVERKQFVQYDTNTGKAIKTTDYRIIKDGDGSKYKVRTEQRFNEQNRQEERRIKEGRKVGEEKRFAQGRAKAAAIARAKAEAKQNQVTQSKTIGFNALQSQRTQPKELKATRTPIDSLHSDINTKDSTPQGYSIFKGATGPYKKEKTTSNLNRGKEEDIFTDSLIPAPRSDEPIGTTLIKKGQQKNYFAKSNQAGFLEGDPLILAGDILNTGEKGIKYAVGHPKTVVAGVAALYAVPFLVPAGVGVAASSIAGGLYIGATTAKYTLADSKRERTQVIAESLTETAAFAGIAGPIMKAGAKGRAFVLSRTVPGQITGTTTIKGNKATTEISGKFGEVLTGKGKSDFGGNPSILKGKHGKNTFTIIEGTKTTSLTVKNPKGKIIKQDTMPNSAPAKVATTAETSTVKIDGITKTTSTIADISIKGRTRTGLNIATTKGSGKIKQTKESFTYEPTGTTKTKKTFKNPTYETTEPSLVSGTTKRSGKINFEVGYTPAKLGDIYQIGNFYSPRFKPSTMGRGLGMGKRASSSFGGTTRGGRVGPDFGTGGPDFGRGSRIGKSPTTKIRSRGNTNPTTKPPKSPTGGVTSNQLRAISRLNSISKGTSFFITPTGYSSKPKTNTGLGSIAPSNPTFTPDAITKSKPSTDILTTPTPVITPDTATGTGSKPAAGSSSITNFITGPSPTTTPTGGFNPPTPFSPFKPFIPILPFPPGLIGGGFGSRGSYARKARQQTRDTTTLTAAAFDITGKSSKIGSISGLGLRLSPKKKKRKNKK